MLHVCWSSGVVPSERNAEPATKTSPLPRSATMPWLLISAMSSSAMRNGNVPPGAIVGAAEAWMGMSAQRPAAPRSVPGGRAGASG